jgi:hypothetical protein
MLLDEVLYHAERQARVAATSISSAAARHNSAVWARLSNELARLPADHVLWKRYAAQWSSMSDGDGLALGHTQRAVLNLDGASLPGEGEPAQFLALLTERLQEARTVRMHPAPERPQ